MSSRRLLAAAFLAGLAVFPAYAQDKAIDCDTTDVDAELLVCAQKDFTKSQARLEQLTAEAVKTLPAKAKPLFQSAQATWSAYRDADCTWNAFDAATGEVTELMRMTCLADLTAGRVEELEAGLGSTQ